MFLFKKEDYYNAFITGIYEAINYVLDKRNLTITAALV